VLSFVSHFCSFFGFIIPSENDLLPRSNFPRPATPASGRLILHSPYPRPVFVLFWQDYAYVESLSVGSRGSLFLDIRHRLIIKTVLVSIPRNCMIVNFLTPHSLWERPWRPSMQGEEHLDEKALARILYMAFS
jgi:hypothetical protein